jgi:hypothetical protein
MSFQCNFKSLAAISQAIVMDRKAAVSQSMKKNEIGCMTRMGDDEQTRMITRSLWLAPKSNLNSWLQSRPTRHPT